MLGSLGELGGGAHTLLVPCPTPQEDTPSPFTLPGRNLPYRPRWLCPSLSPLERRWGWVAGDSAMCRAGEGLRRLLQ